MKQGEQDSVSTALGIDLILEHIFKLSDFETLKKLRLVCKFWNALACRQLKERCCHIPIINTRDWQAYHNFVKAQFSRPIEPPDIAKLKKVRLACKHWNWIFFGRRCGGECRNYMVRESVIRQAYKDHTAQFGSSNPELVLEIPVSLDCKENQLTDDILLDCLPKLQWRSHIVNVKLSVDLTVSQVNRLTLFLLHHLEGLEELTFFNIVQRHWDQRKIDDFQLSVLNGVSSAKFGLKLLEYCIVSERAIEQVLDPGFLRHCPEFKTFKIKCCPHATPNLGSDACFNFFNRWNQMVLAEPGSLPQILELQFDFRMRFRMKVRPPSGFYDSLAQFINLNEPAQLELSGGFDYNFPSFFKQFGAWSRRRVQRLAVAVVPKTDNVDESRFHVFLRLLKQFPVFSHLIEVNFLSNGTYEDSCAELENFQFKAEDQHQLSKVVSIKFPPAVRQHRQIHRRLQETATQVSHVTHLELPKMSFSTNRLNFEPLFESCKQFPALRHLCLQLYDLEESFCTYEDREFGIFCKPLESVKSLKTFEVVIHSLWADMRIALLTLFKGLEPRVQLDLAIVTKYDYNGHLGQITRRRKLALSVEGFKEALRKAARGLALPDSSDLDL